MSRMFCGACGTSVSAGSSFCPSCGQPVASQGTQPELWDNLFDQPREATPLTPQHLGPPGALPVTSASAPGPQLPGVGTTVLVTLFLGLFGLIPATIHTNRAASMGAPTTRYWKAFGWTMVPGALIAVALSAALLLGVFGALSGSNPDQYASSTEVLPEAPQDDSPFTSAPPGEVPSDPPDTGVAETRNAPVVLPSTAGVCAESSGVGPHAAAAVGNAKTSCPFAEAVRSAYDSSGASGTTVFVDAFSPVTEKWYTVQCGGEAPVTCTGTAGLDILIFIYSSDAEILRVG